MYCYKMVIIDIKSILQFLIPNLELQSLTRIYSLDLYVVEASGSWIFKNIDCSKDNHKVVQDCHPAAAKCC